MASLTEIVLGALGGWINIIVIDGNLGVEAFVYLLFLIKWIDALAALLEHEEVRKLKFVDLAVIQTSNKNSITAFKAL